MGKGLWLSRDDNSNGFYNVHKGKPEMNYTGYFNSGCRPPIYSISPENFHKMSPIRLRKGRKRKIKRILIELED